MHGVDYQGPMNIPGPLVPGSELDPDIHTGGLPGTFQDVTDDITDVLYLEVRSDL